MGIFSLKAFVAFGALLILFQFTTLEEVRAELNPIFYESTSDEFSQRLYNSDNSVNRWVEDLNRRALPLLCLGERHDDKFRQFYADHFFSEYTFDVLFMEATQDEADELVSRSLSGEDYVNFLGADISNVIRAIKNKNPNVSFIGVELTQEQKNEVRLSNRLKSREGYIAQNVYNNFNESKKHVMLYGANHCAQYDLGLGRKTPAFKHLQKVLPRGALRSARLMYHHPTNYFSASLAYLDLPSETTVFKDVDQISESYYNYIWDFKKYMSNFNDIIYAYE